MNTMTKAYHLLDLRRVLPILGGILIAAAAAFILRYSYVWSGLITVGLTVFVLSFAAQNFRSYWLAVFALALPLEIKKLLIDSDYVREVIRLNTLPVGALPGPVLYLSDLPFIILMAYWLFEVILKKQKVVFPRSNWMALGFVAWAGLSVLKAPLFSYAFFDLLGRIKYYLIYLYIANNMRSKSEVKALIAFFLVGVAFQGLICLYQFVSQDVSHIFGNVFGQLDLYSQEGLKKYQTFFSVYGPWGSTLKRASGTVGPINAQAQFFEFLLPVALLLWLTAKRFWGKTFNLFVFIIGLLGLIVTFSRGGLIGLIVGVSAALLFSWIIRMISNKQFLVILFVYLFLSVIFIPKLFEFISTRPEAAIARLPSMKVAVNIIKDHPIMGVGLNNNLIAVADYDPNTYFMQLPTHNYYLLIGTETGIPGLVFFIGFLSLSCAMTLKAARSDDLYIASVSIAIFGAFIAVSLHLLVDWIATNTNHTLFWVYGGLSACLYRMNEMPEKMD
jgi:O-antigen ligase